jgi:hypothetical protein
VTRAETLGAPGAHLDEGALLRRMDGELELAESAGVEAHLAACGRCRAELDEMAAVAGRVSSALRLIDVAPQIGREPARERRAAAPPWHRSAIWRAAAVIALVAGLGLAIAPIRAWVAERLGLAGDRNATTESPTADPPATAPTGGSSVRVAFVPAGDRFRILLATPQVEGALHLAAAPGDTASGEIVGADGADLLVLPDGLGIRNHPFSTAEYRVAVPRRIASVVVEIAGREEWRGSPENLSAAGIRIGLGDGLDRSTNP